MMKLDCKGPWWRKCGFYPPANPCHSNLYPVIKYRFDHVSLIFKLGKAFYILKVADPSECLDFVWRIKWESARSYSSQRCGLILVWRLRGSSSIQSNIQICQRHSCLSDFDSHQAVMAPWLSYQTQVTRHRDRQVYLSTVATDYTLLHPGFATLKMQNTRLSTFSWMCSVILNPI